MSVSLAVAATNQNPFRIKSKCKAEKIIKSNKLNTERFRNGTESCTKIIWITRDRKKWKWKLLLLKPKTQSPKDNIKKNKQTDHKWKIGTVFSPQKVEPFWCKSMLLSSLLNQITYRVFWHTLQIWGYMMVSSLNVLTRMWDFLSTNC